LFIEIQLHLCSPSLWSNAYLRQISLACLHIWFSPSSALSFYNLKSMIYLIWFLIYIILIQHIHQSFKLSVRILQWNELIVYGNHQSFVSDIQATPHGPPPQGSVHYLRFGGGGGGGGGVYALRQYSTAVRNTILLKAARINILCNDFLLFSFFASNFLMKITLLRPGVMLGLHRFFNHENYEDRMRLCLKKTAIFVVTNVLAPGFEGKKRG
jgi:hypothetical protein